MNLRALLGLDEPEPFPSLVSPVRRKVPVAVTESEPQPSSFNQAFENIYTMNVSGGGHREDLANALTVLTPPVGDYAAIHPQFSGCSSSTQIKSWIQSFESNQQANSLTQYGLHVSNPKPLARIEGRRSDNMTTSDFARALAAGKFHRY